MGGTPKDHLGDYRVTAALMRVALFTCRRDAGKAALATRTVPLAWPVTWIVDAPDADLEAPRGVKLLVAPFPRGRNLSGTLAVLNIATILTDLAREDGRVLKIDSDCLLIDPQAFSDGDLAGMAHKFTPGAAYGLCYALSKASAWAALTVLRRSAELGTVLGGEDTAITASALAGGGTDYRFPIGAFWESKHNGELPPAGRVAIHCGAAAYAPREGPAVAREMARLGDALGLWRR